VCGGDGKVNVVGYDKVELTVRVDLFGSCYMHGNVSNECSVM